MGSRVDDYKFLQIVDAMASINQKVNLIGVVVETSIPKQSRGSDCFCTIKIVDESLTSPGISVNFFTETMEKLPQIDAAGDIIQLSRVVMKTHGSEVYALFNKKFSSFALYEGKSNTSHAPYQFSPHYHAREQDKKLIDGLRDWIMNHQIVPGCVDTLQLNEITQGERISIVCKILHVVEVKKDESVLFVWDGTDTPPLPIKRKPVDELENPLPLQLEPVPLPREILCTFPVVGTTLRVGASYLPRKLGVGFLKIGRWVKFVNLKCEDDAGIWHAVLMPNTKLCYLPPDDDLVLQRQRSYDERVSNKWGWIPLTSFPWHSQLTETDHPDVPFSSLLNVVCYQEVTAKFRCIVRIVAAFPWRAEDFCSPLGTYRIRLTLEDPTARVHAFLYGGDAVKFFGSCSNTDEITKKRNILFGVPDSYDGSADEEEISRNPPWIECCLKSYYLDKTDVLGSRRYRIFGTRFVK